MIPPRIVNYKGYKIPTTFMMKLRTDIMCKIILNSALACVNVVASAMANGTFTTRASVFASKVFPILGRSKKL